MKFAIALIALFAVSAQSSAVWPYAAWPYHHAPITQYSSIPAVHLAHHASPISYAHHVSAVHPAVHAYHAPAAVAVHHGYAAPAVHVAHAPAVHVAHAPIVHAKHSATYTAANRGSVHTAPLEGHAVSQTSLNLAPAPGTH